MRQNVKNNLTAVFSARSENESLARVMAAGFLLQYPVTAEELADIKTALSEAVTNAIVHGYRDRTDGAVKVDFSLFNDGRIRITVSDRGCGIEDVARAREPFFTTDRAHERGGMGFSIMETFMDRVRVKSVPGRSTRVVLEKRLSLWK
ncbi:MAG: anti-sigma F factor [Clostridia bacterium]|nr:anti-sigma F factor [Clostridia bacterium]